MHDIVLDLETEKRIDEVGGRDRFGDLGLTVVGVYIYGTDEYRTYERHEITELEELLMKSRRIIGFNIRDFDIPVLAPHIQTNVFSFPILDLMDDVVRSAGFRISLDNLARTTLGVAKSGNGLDAIKWWKNGEKEKVKSYCLQDVQVTRELYEYGRTHGAVFFESKYGGVGKQPLRVNWGRIEPSEINDIIKRGFSERRSLEIEYEPSGEKRSVHTVDVHAIDHRHFDGYCHIKKGKRSFQFDGVKSVKVTNRNYQLEQDVQRSLI